VVVVTGLRQAGKSTFLQAEPGLEGRAYRSLDDFAQLAAARADPEAFVKADGPLTIDEVQKCPELLPAIKRAVDRDRRPGWFLLSGSANLALLRGIPESLAGRAVYLTLHPFTRNEIAGIPTGVAYLRRLFDEGGLPKTSRRPASVTVADLVTGGMPSVCLGEVRNPGLWFQGYEQTYLERDVRDLARVADLVSFRSLLRLAALRTGQVLKVSELGRDAKLPVATASRYLALMEVSFVLRRLGPYLPSTASRLIKSPKIYVADSGLAAHLVGASSSALSADANLRGALFETYVAQNLASLIETGWPGARLHYWHVQGRYEVDFVIEVGRESLAVELKSYGRWSERDLAGLRAFLDRTPRCRAGILAHNGEQAVKLGERLWAIPIALLLSS
jgi:hypothetical protein